MFSKAWNFIYIFLIQAGIYGWEANLLASLIMAVIISLLIVIIGSIINLLDIYAYRLLACAFNDKAALIISDYLTFPGVMLHELAHALVIFICGGKILQIKLFEIKKASLGHVTFATQGSRFKQTLQLSLGGSAPVFVGICVINFFYNILHDFSYSMTTGWKIFIWYMIVSIFLHASMSIEDLKNYFKGCIFLVPCLTIVLFISRIIYNFFSY